jgi:hypothetical protein
MARPSERAADKTPEGRPSERKRPPLELRLWDKPPWEKPKPTLLPDSAPGRVTPE